MEIRDFINGMISDFDISITTGYTGYKAGELLYAAKNYIAAMNETVAIDFSHIFSYLGKRSLVIMKNAGLNQSFLAIINSTVLGTNAGLVIYVIDDLQVVGSEMAQDSTHLVEQLGIKPRTPKNWAELYKETRNAYIVSEEKKIPQIIVITNELFETEILFESEVLSNECKPLKEMSVLHPKTADSILAKFSVSKQIETKLFPQIPNRNYFSEKLTSAKYEKLFQAIPENIFDLVIGDFGTYTLASKSPIHYGLHYGSAVASGVGATLAGYRPLVITGEGGLTSNFSAVLELLRKDVNVKIILIENGGISEKEPVGINLTNLLSNLGISNVSVSENELGKIKDYLADPKLFVISVQFN